MEGFNPKKDDGKIAVFSDTFPLGILEKVMELLGKLGVQHAYSTGDHVPMSLDNPKTRMQKMLKEKAAGSGKKINLHKEMNRLYLMDGGFRKDIDDLYRMISYGLDHRKDVISSSGIRIDSCVGNQERMMGDEMRKKRFMKNTIPEFFRGSGLEYHSSPAMFVHESTLVVLIPYKRTYRGMKGDPEGIADRISEEWGERFGGMAADAKRCILLSHYSVDFESMVSGFRRVYGDSGFRGSEYHTPAVSLGQIIAFYKLACSHPNLGAEVILGVHGHYHLPTFEYEPAVFPGVRILNLNIGAVFLMDPLTGESRIHGTRQK